MVWLTHFGPINLKESTWSVFRQEGKESEVLVESDTELSARPTKHPSA